MSAADFVTLKDRLRPSESGLRHAVATLQRGEGGDDFRNFEPVIAAKSLSFSKLDKIVLELRRIHKENPDYFDVPTFAQKIY